MLKQKSAVCQPQPVQKVQFSQSRSTGCTFYCWSWRSKSAAAFFYVNALLHFSSSLLNVCNFFTCAKNAFSLAWKEHPMKMWDKSKLLNMWKTRLDSTTCFKKILKYIGRDGTLVMVWHLLHTLQTRVQFQLGASFFNPTFICFYGCVVCENNTEGMITLGESERL